MFGTPAFVVIPAVAWVPSLACIPNVVNIPLLMVFSLLMVSLPLLTSPNVPFVSCAGFCPTVPDFITANVLLKSSVYIIATTPTAADISSDPNFLNKILKKNRLSPAVALNPGVTISVVDLDLDPDPNWIRNQWGPWIRIGIQDGKK
jgi:hypothetical protein